VCRIPININGLVAKNGTSDMEVLHVKLQEAVDGKIVLPESGEGLGRPVYSYEEFKTLSDLDILARVIYAENTSPENVYQEAVAWTIINRRNFPESYYYGWSYRDILIAPGQYAEIYQYEGTTNAYTPNTSSYGWKKAVSLATKMLSDS